MFAHTDGIFTLAQVLELLVEFAGAVARDCSESKLPGCIARSFMRKNGSEHGVLWNVLFHSSCYIIVWNICLILSLN